MLACNEVRRLKIAWWHSNEILAFPVVELSVIQQTHRTERFTPEGQIFKYYIGERQISIGSVNSPEVIEPHFYVRGSDHREDRKIMRASVSYFREMLVPAIIGYNCIYNKNSIKAEDVIIYIGKGER